jgi:hypothetical protein
MALSCSLWRLISRETSSAVKHIYTYMRCDPTLATKPEGNLKQAGVIWFHRPNVAKVVTPIVHSHTVAPPLFRICATIAKIFLIKKLGKPVVKRGRKATGPTIHQESGQRGCRSYTAQASGPGFQRHRRGRFRTVQPQICVLPNLNGDGNEIRKRALRLPHIVSAN